MPKFTVERNWIECIGHMWMPNAVAAKGIDLRAYDIENIKGCTQLCGDSGITREGVAHWLSLNEGDFQSVDDFAAFITDAPEMPWEDEESEFTFSDCMYGSEEE